MTPDAPEAPTFPKVPALDPAALKAVRNSLPGKLLGRAAAILATLVLVLGFAELADARLTNLRLNLSPPWLDPVLLIGLPIAIIAAQLLNESRAQRNRRQAIELAIKPASVPEGYFRIGPYLDIEQDHAAFSRPDQAHNRVLTWLRKSDSIPCYLTGDSGCGKSSILNAFVFPAFRRDGWTITVIRAGQDAEAALREHLKPPHSPNVTTIRDLIEAATRRCQQRLLLVLDQFEEFLILGTPAQQQALATTLDDLHKRPIKGLKILVGMRSDYQPALEEIGLPRLLQDENFVQVGRFREGAARSFFMNSNLGLKDEPLDRLLKSAAELDDTPGMIRPVTLNVLGYVLQQRGGAVAPSLDAGALVRGYIAQSIGNPAIRDFAPPVLEALLTEQGTKRPRRETELAAEVKLRTAEVRAVLHALAGAALTRPLDATQNVWEYSHDFVARAVSRYIGRRRAARVRRVGAYAAPTLLALGVMIGSGALGWSRLAPVWARAELTKFRVSPDYRDDGLHITLQGSDDEEFARIAPLLATLTVTELDLANSQITNFKPLQHLTALQRLDLHETKITNLEPLQRLTKIKELNLYKTRVTNLEPLQHLTALQDLDLEFTPVTNLEPLRGLTSLKSLHLSNSSVTNLEPLRGLTSLERLSLSGTLVTNLDPLRGLNALPRLDLDETAVTNLEPLQGLTGLKELYLSLKVSDEELNRVTRYRRENGLQNVHMEKLIPQPN